MTAVTAVLMLLTVPVTAGFYRSRMHDQSVRDLESLLRRARTYAIDQRNDLPSGVKILPGSYVLFVGESYASRTTALDESFEYPTFVTTSGSISEVVFSKLHGTSTASGTIRLLTTEGVEDQITIFSSGVVNRP